MNALLDKELEWDKVNCEGSPYILQPFTDYIDKTKLYRKQVWFDGYEEIFRLSGRKL